MTPPVVTYPAEHVAAGLGDVGGSGEFQRPLHATLWGTPPLGHTAARLADGTAIGWRSGRWELPEGRDITVLTPPRAPKGCSMLAPCTSTR